jgi:Fe-S-cluster-containing dehydrogenase component
MARYGMAFDYKLCINCKACEVACKEENGIDLGAKNHRLWIDVKEVDGDFWNLNPAKDSFLQMQCQECEDAPCLKACPSKAIYKDENSIIRIHEERCDLSLNCVRACPYNARYININTNPPNIPYSSIIPSTTFLSKGTSFMVLNLR